MLKRNYPALFKIFMIYFFILFNSCQKNQSIDDLCKELGLNYPAKGFVSKKLATRWEESLVTGNGTIGALIRGIPGDETIILSHEKLFMPQYPPTKAPNLKKYLPKIRALILEGRGDKAAELAVQAGREAGITDVVWTDPLVPACQLEIKSLENQNYSKYLKCLNFESGEATIA
ncbi:MAG: glycoside hydrolase N-terminal domain-containing protein, partial [Caldisericaceae bacterium]|nr:glycoside hydrolase N-terminal domain-containing protein [Caldisericaceae bacterium]